MKPPPGQMITALPLGTPPVGLYSVSVGRLTFVTTSVFQAWKNTASPDWAPGDCRAHLRNRAE
jgi:hypothetical protein